MRRRCVRNLLMAAVLSCGLPSVTNAQAEASDAFKAGKQAFDAGQFDKAKEQFQTASQTDSKNPEVFLWLGKAQYQLGQVDAAIASWKRTAALAPAEPYSAQMLKALTGQTADIEVSLSVLKSLLTDELYLQAVTTADRLLSDQSLSVTQRVSVLSLRAEGLLGVNRFPDAIAAANELSIKYAANVDKDQVRLIVGRAKLRAGGERAADGAALIGDVLARNVNAPGIAAAHFDLLNYQLDQGVEPAKLTSLSQWIAAHPNDDYAQAARRKVIEAHLTLASRGGEVARAADLSPDDTSALASAADYFKHSPRSDDALQVTNRILTHLQEKFGRVGALAAAKSAANTLLQSTLPPTSRIAVLRIQARFASELALREIADQVRAGQVSGQANALPAALAETLTIYRQIDQQPMSGGAWKDQAAVAERLRELASQIPWPAKPTELKVPLAWSVMLAQPVVQAGADTTAMTQATRTVTTIVNDVAAAEAATPAGMALAANSSLLSSLSPDRPEWSAVAFRQVDLLDASAFALFNLNIRDGKSADNAKISKPQLELLTVLANVVTVQASTAPQALQRIEQHLRPWQAVGQWTTADAAYAQFLAKIPENRRRAIELAQVNLWIQQAITEQNRLIAAGLGVPREIDPQFLKAARRLYELQADVPQEDPFLAQVRSLLDSVINHYKSLGYFDTAKVAASTRPDPVVKPSPQGEVYIEFKLALLAEESARREVETQMGKFSGAKKLAISPAIQAAIADYSKFIADHPTDPLASVAVTEISGLAGLFQEQGSFDAAGQIFSDLAKFAAARPALSQSTPMEPSLEERASFAALGAIEAKARAEYEASRSAEKGEIKPPTNATPAYDAAVGAYFDFIKSRPSSPLVGAAVSRVMAIALDWTRYDAWDVADGLYAALLKPELKLRKLERIEFARGMCQVGKVMPDHAREVLTAMTQGGPASPATQPGLAFYDWNQRELAGGFRKGMGGGSGGGAGGAGGGVAPGQEWGAVAGRKPPSAVAAAPAPATPVAPPMSGPVGSPAEMPSISGVVAAEGDRSRADREVLAAISVQESRRSAQVALLRDGVSNLNAPAKRPAQSGDGQQAAGDTPMAPPVLSDAELARQATAVDAAYTIFKSIRVKDPATTTAAQARAESLVLVGHWRANAQWQRAAELGRTFLADNPADAQLPQLRLGIAQDTLTWAATPIDTTRTSANRQQVLAETSKRFEAARQELTRIVADFADERQLRQDAQWQLATSFLTQAHTVGVYSPTLARGQLVRAVTEMQKAAAEYYDHPQVATIPQILWDVSQELSSRGFHEEAISVWNDLAVRYPQHSLSQQAMMRMAETYQTQLGRPLRAAEVYLEINYARGGSDASAQAAIYQIGSTLRSQSRWVEALHVLQTFVASFPKNPQAAQALTMIGQIHQANEAWAEAIDSYKRVTAEFGDNAQQVQEARWSIAECTINLSLWKEAIGAYQSFASDYKQDSRVPEANRRSTVLKDLAKYQQLVKEKGPKAFDAQFQIATIVQSQLANPSKAIVEFRKVAQDWPQSHLADDGLYQAGMAFLQLGRTEQARAALAEMAAKYSDSPLADDALLAIGKSYEDEAQQLTSLTRDQQNEQNKDVAQKQAYSSFNFTRTSRGGAQNAKVQELRQNGQAQQAELEEAKNTAGNNLIDNASVNLVAQKAMNDVECQTAGQLADRQDKINASLRKAADAYAQAAKVPGADRAGEALLRMATIQGERLNDSRAAMNTWLEIVRQFSGTAVAEEASWKIAQNYEKDAKFAEAIDAYKAFLRNYRGSTRAGDAQFAVAENYEHLNEWVKAMDSYANYVNGFPQGTMVQKAKEQITWIKTYRL